MKSYCLRNAVCFFFLICGLSNFFLNAQEFTHEFSFGARFVDEEFKRLHTVKLPEIDARGHFDWRDFGAVTNAGNQGSCGSCWAFALTGVMESKIFLEHGFLYKLSEQFMQSCASHTSPTYSYGCCGSYATAYNFYVTENPVILSEMPFADGSTRCADLECPPTCSNVECDLSKPRIGVLAEPDSLFFVDEHDPAQVIALIENSGPSWLAFRVHTDFLTYWYSPLGTEPWTDGVYVNNTASFEGAHAVLLVGYDTEGEYWICRNSWGRNGGPFGDGSFKMAWSGHTADIITEVAHYEITGVPDPPTPTPTPTQPPTATPTFPPPPNNNCPGQIITTNTCICASSQGALNNFDCGIGFDGGDIVYQLTDLQIGSVYQFIAEADYNADFAISTVCDEYQGDLMCAHFKDPHIDPSCSIITTHHWLGYASYQWTATQQNYWIWIDSYAMGLEGNYCFEVFTVSTPTPIPTAAPQILHVPSQYSTIQSAIDAATDNDTVLVANGTYTGTGNKNLDFGGKAIIVKSDNGPDYCTIDCQNSGRAVAFTQGETETSVFSGFTVLNGQTASGGGAFIQYSQPVISNCIFVSNSSTGDGGAIYCEDANPYISDCIMINNTAFGNGGAIFCYDASPLIVNCLLVSNWANDYGGALCCESYSSPQLINSTVFGNTADLDGGGIVSLDNSNPQITSCILWENDPGQITLPDGTISVMYSNIAGGYSGTGNINLDPMFVTGAKGNFYLDPVLSPCINAGHDVAAGVCFRYEDWFRCLDLYTTRPDEAPDLGVVDMGYHYPLTVPPTYTPTPTVTPTGTQTPPANVIWVPDDYTTIDAALTAATNGKIIIVRDGIYTGEANRNLSFDGKSIILRSENGPDNCIIDGQEAGRLFTFNSGETTTSVLQGFTIRNGLSDDDFGGAITIVSSSPLVTNCIFTSNVSSFGGGAVMIGQNAQPMFTDCQFSMNSTIDPDGQGGGAVLVHQISGTTKAAFINCLFSANSSDDGGAIRIRANGNKPDITLKNCTLANNYATNGQHLFATNAKLTIDSSIVWDFSTQPVFLFVGSTVDVNYSNVRQDTGVYPGTENINQNPQFVSGHYGPFYLGLGSPCIDTGSAAASDVCYQGNLGLLSCLSSRSTRIDGVVDSGVVDMGYHYRSVSPTIRRVPQQYATIQNAIDSSIDSDIVLVADGTYTGIGNKNLNFNGKRIRVMSENGPYHTIIDCQGSGRGISFVTDEDNSSVFDGFTIRNGGNVTQGGAIFCQYSSPVISNCILSFNNAAGDGAGIYSEECSLTVTNVIFFANYAQNEGGGVFTYDSSDSYNNCLFDGNYAGTGGGGAMCDNYSMPSFTNCTFYGNEADLFGGGLVVSGNSEPEALNSIFYSNTFNELYVISGNISVSYSNVYGGWPGVGNISGNPAFVSGALGDTYLDYSTKTISPCIDAGSASANAVCFATGQGDLCMSDLTTRLDAMPDNGLVDMGFHYALVSSVPTATPTPYQTPTPLPAVIRVPADYATIQQAINAAVDGDTVLVADGTYTGNGNKNLNTLGKKITVISENGPANTVIDCEHEGRGFFFDSFELNSTVINGFTIQNGYVDSGNFPEAGGGGMLFYWSAPQIENCVIKSSYAMYGGGIMIYESEVMFINCLIVDNGLLSQSVGGGLYSHESVAILNNCTVADNSAVVTFDGRGGGVFHTEYSELYIRDSILWNNEPESIDGESEDVSVTYSLVQQDAGVFPGEGNINTDPLFVTGYQGYFYLDAAPASTSPCIDAGSQLASEQCLAGMGSLFCMSDMSTNIGGEFDSGQVDMGFHYDSFTGPTATPIQTNTPTSPPQPTNTPRPSNTPNPTRTPTPVPTYTPDPPTHTPAPPTDTPTPVCMNHGDVDFNGFLTAGDAQMAFNIALGLYLPTVEEECAADCNANGVVTAGDAQMIFYAALSFIPGCEDPL
jgi:predicted outer membrane repeat protein